MKILELFAGHRSIGKIAEREGHEVFSIDMGDFPNIDSHLDIYNLKIDDIDFIPDVVWASPDCTTYSLAGCGHHRNADKSPYTDYAKECDKGNRQWISVLRQWLEINPNLTFFIENPRAIMKKMDFVQDFDEYEVWYCQYGAKIAKPTNIWTNSKAWKPRKKCHNKKRDKITKEIIHHCHHEHAPRGSRTGLQGIKGADKRSIIPKELCEEIIGSLSYNITLHYTK